MFSSPSLFLLRRAETRRLLFSLAGLCKKRHSRILSYPVYAVLLFLMKIPVQQLMLFSFEEILI